MSGVPTNRQLASSMLRCPERKAREKTPRDGSQYTRGARQLCRGARWQSRLDEAWWTMADCRVVDLPCLMLSQTLSCHQEWECHPSCWTLAADTNDIHGTGQ
jgi:hypothetical protein